MSRGDNLSTELLRGFVERIERLEGEKRALSADLAEVYKELREAGFDTAVIRLIVKERRVDKDDFAEQQSLLETYRRALGNLPLFEAAG